MTFIFFHLFIYYLLDPRKFEELPQPRCMASNDDDVRNEVPKQIQKSKPLDTYSGRGRDRGRTRENQREERERARERARARARESGREKVRERNEERESARERVRARKYARVCVRTRERLLRYWQKLD